MSAIVMSSIHYFAGLSIPAAFHVSQVRFLFPIDWCHCNRPGNHALCGICSFFCRLSDGSPVSEKYLKYQGLLYLCLISNIIFCFPNQEQIQFVQYECFQISHHHFLLLNDAALVVPRNGCAKSFCRLHINRTETAKNTWKKANSGKPVPNTIDA